MTEEKQLELTQEQPEISAEASERALASVAERLNMQPEPAKSTTGQLSLNVQTMREIYQIATIFSMSNLVPESYRGRKDSVGHANCFVALSMGFELGIPPMMALQKIYVINGKPGIEAQLAIAMANQRAPIVGPIGYDEGGKGDEQFCVAYAIDKRTRERVEYRMTIQDAKDAGWYNKSQSKWQTIPKLMLRYRSAAYLIRTNYPDAIMGLQTREELEDLDTEESSVESVAQRLSV